MPLEVRQIGIHLNVGDGDQGQADDDSDSGLRAPAQGLDPSERAEIVEECVEAMLAALRMQSER